VVPFAVPERDPGVEILILAAVRMAAVDLQGVGVALNFEAALVD